MPSEQPEIRCDCGPWHRAHSTYHVYALEGSQRMVSLENGPVCCSGCGARFTLADGVVSVGDSVEKLERMVELLAELVADETGIDRVCPPGMGQDHANPDSEECTHAPTCTACWAAWAREQAHREAKGAKTDGNN